MLRNETAAKNILRPPFIRIKIYFSCFEIHIVRRDNLTKFVISLLSTYTSIYTRTDTETPRSNREYIMRNLDRYSASQRPMDIVLLKHVAYTQRESRKDIRYTCLYYTLYIYIFFLSLGKKREFLLSSICSMDLSRYWLLTRNEREEKFVERL